MTIDYKTTDKMAFTKGRTILVALIMMLGMMACNNAGKKEKEQKRDKFILKGKIEGMDSGLIKIQFDKKFKKEDTARIVNGEFTLISDYPEPTLIGITEEKIGLISYMFAENAEFTLTANMKNLHEAKITGGSAHADMLKHGQIVGHLRDTLSIANLEMNIHGNSLSKERRSELNTIMDETELKIKAIDVEFIKNNPKSHYSAWLAYCQLVGASLEEKAELIALLDPSLYNTTYIKQEREKIAIENTTDSSIEDFVSHATNINYKVDEQFKGKELKNVVYLGMFSDNNICALTIDGKLQIIAPNGSKLTEFKLEQNGRTTGLAVDQANNIFVTSVLEKKVQAKSRGRVIEKINPIGVECAVYNEKGEKKTQFTCDGITTAAGVRVMDGKLFVSDSKNGVIGIFDAKTGKQLSQIKNLRQCCGMLDFTLNDQKQLVVANLGAFRVEAYDLKGISVKSFGKRGRDINSFHGCCNPVSVSCLKSGAIVTAEKDPTQIKVFSKDGAKQIDGIEELVKGCSYIPMTVDSDDNLYLASREKGIVKCVAI